MMTTGNQQLSNNDLGGGSKDEQMTNQQPRPFRPNELDEDQLLIQSDNDKDYLGAIQEKNGDEKLYDSFFDEEKLNFQPEESQPGRKPVRPKILTADDGD